MLVIEDIRKREVGEWHQCADGLWVRVVGGREVEVRGQSPYE